MFLDVPETSIGADWNSRIPPFLNLVAAELFLYILQQDVGLYVG